MKDQRLTEQTLSTQKVYSGPVFDVYSDSVKLYNGTESRRDYLLHRGAVAIVPLTDDGCVIMERQYRYPHRRVMYEIPAGKLEAFDTDPLEAAKRELLEETGVTAGDISSLGIYIPSPAILSEKIHVYLARGLTFGETCPDEDEFLEVERIPLEKLTDMILSNQISDGKTVFGILKTKLLLEREKHNG